MRGEYRTRVGGFHSTTSNGLGPVEYLNEGCVMVATAVRMSNA